MAPSVAHPPQKSVPYGQSPYIKNGALGTGTTLWGLVIGGAVRLHTNCASAPPNFCGENRPQRVWGREDIVRRIRHSLLSTVANQNVGKAPPPRIRGIFAKFFGWTL